MGALTFVFLSIPYMSVTGKVLGVESTTNKNAWQIMSDYDANFDGYTLFKILTIVLIVIAALLIICGIIALLENLGIIKSKKMNFALIADCVLLLFVVAAVVQLIGGISLCNYLSGDIYVAASSASMTVGMWLNLIVGALACVCAFAATLTGKKGKRK